MKNLYPVMLDLTGKKCLVVGGGKVAARKVKTLLNSFSGVEIEIISPSLCCELIDILNKESKDSNIDFNIYWKQKEYEKGDLREAFLVFACTGDELINTVVAREAKEEKILVNCVSVPEESDFIVPASISRGNLNISVSTGGASPALSRMIKEKIESQFSGDWEKYISFLGYCREKIKEKVSDQQKRREIYYQLIENDSIFERVQNIQRKNLDDFSRKVIDEFLDL